MSETRVSFVILHYQTSVETCNCIDSIFNIDIECPYYIVVVDNGSPNKSGVYIENRYKDNQIVNVIILENNIGFAKGNNVGIRYSREILGVDYVVCINNDTLMIDREFVDKMINEYKYSKAAIIGPMILLPKHLINIFDDKLHSTEHYIIDRENYLSGRIKTSVNRSFIKDILKKCNVLCIVNNRMKCIRFQMRRRKENAVLHGACLMFTPAFFEKMGGFDERTFLYHEEHILFHQIIKKGLKTVYNPNLKIFHLEDSSTNSIDEDVIKFKMKHEIESLNVLIEELQSVD